MVGVELLLRLVGGVVLLFANGFFVTTEFAMTRVPQFDSEELQGSAGLERAAAMVEELEIYLSGCQVGITVSSVGLGFVAEPAVTRVVNSGLAAAGLVASADSHGVLSVALALGVVNLAHVVVGEQAPTYLGVERSKQVASYCAPALYYWTRLMGPVIRVADWTAKRLLGLFGVTIHRSWTEAETEGEGEPAGEDGEGHREGSLTAAELRREMGEVLSRGSVPRERREEVLNTLRIGRTPVSAVMVPRAEMKALSTETDPAEALATMERNPQHTRFPLFDADPESAAAADFVGVVYLPTVLPHIDELRAGEQRLRDIAAPPMTVEADLPVAALIDRFQAENQELAVVLEDREVVGVVTATDAFEAIAGEVKDPLDASTP